MTNEQIATEVMGWRQETKRPAGMQPITVWIYPYEGEDCVKTKLPDFHNDHNAAMMVVEKMREDGWKWLSGSVDSGGHYFKFYKDDCYQEFKVYHESLCHAICEAALKAKGN